MRNIFFSRQAKIVVDILLVAGLVVACSFQDTGNSPSAYWQSPHCMSGILWFLFIVVHVIQHWKFIKALNKKKVFRKNKITGITTICFFLMGLSILLFTVGFPFSFLKFHHIIGHLFPLIVIIHTIQKYKTFVSLFRKKRIPQKAIS